MTKRKRLVRIGNSRGLIMDKGMLEALGWDSDQLITISVIEDDVAPAILIECAKSHGLEPEAATKAPCQDTRQE